MSPSESPAPLAIPPPVPPIPLFSGRLRLSLPQLNFLFVPPAGRVFYVATVSAAWGAYLSWLNHRR